MKLSGKTELRTATTADLPAIYSVWQKVFGDSEAYVADFFEARCSLDSTLILLEEGKVVSQLFLLPAQLKVGKAIYPIRYLYAAATLPENRGLGYMGQLIRAAHEFVLCHGEAGIALMPGEDSLYNYYAGFGYKSVFSRRHWSGSRQAVEASAVSAMSEPKSAVAFLQKDQHTRDGIVWSKEALQNVLQSFDAYSATEHSFVGVSEQCVIHSGTEDFPEALGFLLALSPEDHFDLILPPDAPMGQLQKGGMFWCAGEDITIENAYLSFPME